MIELIKKENISSIKLHEQLGFVYEGKSLDEYANGYPINHLGYIYKSKTNKKN